MSIAKEFREFISRGNVIDLAVGVVIGGAFGAIVKSLVDNIVMPPIGWALGKVDFSKLELVLRPENPATTDIEKVAIGYGVFINSIISFLIIAVAVFALVKIINTIRRQQAAEPGPETPAAPTISESLLVEIRDLLKAQSAPQPAPAPKVVPVAAKKTPPRKST